MNKWRLVIFLLVLSLLPVGMRMSASADEVPYEVISLNQDYTINGKQGEDCYFRYPIDETRYGLYTLWMEGAEETLRTWNATINGHPQYGRNENLTQSPIDFCLRPTAEQARFRLVKIKPVKSLVIKGVPEANAKSILSDADKANYDGIRFWVNYTDGSAKEYLFKKTVMAAGGNSSGRSMYWTDDGSYYVPEFDKSTGTLKLRAFWIGDSAGVLSDGFQVKVPEPAPAVKKTQTITGVKKHYIKSVTSKRFTIPAKAATKMLFSSDNKKVAVVSSKGVVTLKGPGEANIWITATENESYQKAVFRTNVYVKPKKTVIRSLKRGKKKITVIWKKVNADITGYQILYSTHKSMKNASDVTVTGRKKTTKTIKGLKKNKKYYVQIRTFKKINGVKYFSNWSGKKTVKTK